MCKINFYVKKYTSSTDKDFYEALKIYNDNIPANIKTKTNDIIYFVDHNEQQINRKMYFLGLYTDNKLMGFVMAGYLRKTKTIIIDYIVLKKEYHLNSIFYPLFSLILRFFSDEMIDYDYIVTEVSKNCPDESIDIENFFSKKMLQIEDFRLIDQLYLQPQLGFGNEESNVEFQLMIKSTQVIKSLKKQTYLSIVQDIYYEHYLSWYALVDVENKENYEKHINQQFEEIEKSLKTAEVELTIQNPACKFFQAPDCHYYSTAGFILNEENPKNRPMLLLAIPIIIIIAFVLTYFLYFLLDKFKLNSQVFAGIFAAITAACVGIVALAFSKVNQK